MRWSVLAKGSIRPRKIGLSFFLSISLGLLAFSAIASSQERPAALQLKLGEKGLQAFRTEVNWNDPDTQAAAEAVMRG